VERDGRVTPNFLQKIDEIGFCGYGADMFQEGLGVPGVTGVTDKMPLGAMGRGREDFAAKSAGLPGFFCQIAHGRAADQAAGLKAKIRGGFYCLGCFNQSRPGLGNRTWTAG